MNDQHVDLRGKVMVITGGNSGIGLEAAVGLARQGATVVITSRDREKGRVAFDEIARRSGSDEVAVLPLDLASFDSIHAFADELLDRYDRLDVLVNNAGGILSDRRVTEEGFEATFGANHLGPFLLTDLLADRLRASAPARIVNVASIAHRAGDISVADPFFEERRYDAMGAYSQSKLANILHANELAVRLAGTGVTANSLHPGAVASGFGSADDTSGFARVALALGRPFMIGPEKGARTTVHLASSPEVERVTGGYFVKSRRHNPSRRARDRQLAARLWALSEELVSEGEATRAARRTDDA